MLSQKHIVTSSLEVTTQQSSLEVTTQQLGTHVAETASTRGEKSGRGSTTAQYSGGTSYSGDEKNGGGGDKSGGGGNTYSGGEKKGMLRVTLRDAKGLSNGDLLTSDPYVIVSVAGIERRSRVISASVRARQ